MPPGGRTIDNGKRIVSGKRKITIWRRDNESLLFARTDGDIPLGTIAACQHAERL